MWEKREKKKMAQESGNRNTALDGDGGWHYRLKDSMRIK